MGHFVLTFKSVFNAEAWVKQSFHIDQFFSPRFSITVPISEIKVRTESLAHRFKNLFNLVKVVADVRLTSLDPAVRYTLVVQAHWCSSVDRR